ncbi:MAG: PilZ domain-containing protein [Planctomycetes bacterium]|nr:PilZ domain-containing protein [Planctomycetota bacterium]
MAKKVSQKEIASRLKLDRTTVTKILNRDPNYSASPGTRERVFKAAEELGYDFASIRRPFRREYGRKVINAEAGMKIALEDGTVFDEGTCLLRNVSVGGALLARLSLTKMVLPLVNFTIMLSMPWQEGEEELVGECEVVRLAEATDTGEPELGVRFVNLTFTDKQRLRKFAAGKTGGA